MKCLHYPNVWFFLSVLSAKPVSMFGINIGSSRTGSFGISVNLQNTTHNKKKTRKAIIIGMSRWTNTQLATKSPWTRTREIYPLEYEPKTHVVGFQVLIVITILRDICEIFRNGLSCVFRMWWLFYRIL